ncbi:hypothetical protein MKO06_00595 [Gramella sp. GC03-9]|uniref:YhhN-like protein n=1 Tax=Christiangramia oceanisediminis TaxID=2920386 RepID=A0A9X2KUR3_9FLAO|nr:hypothetical protein [Gramella oceanisediminis]MCP9198387.1 hypothetical protein [Gramella oceanisediminis]
MSSKISFSVTGIILVLLNFMIILQMDLEYSRWARLISTTCILSMLLFYGNRDRSLFTAFSLFILADILLFYYEYDLFNAMTFLTRISAYVMLIILVAPELKKLQVNLFQKIIFLTVFGLNFGMLILLVDMVPAAFRYKGMDFLFYLYGLSMMGMVIAAISYSNRYSSRKSFYFTLATLCLVFSDISSFIAYYLDFQQFYFADRFFYILAIMGLVKFSALSEKHQAVAGLERL